MANDDWLRSEDAIIAHFAELDAARPHYPEIAPAAKMPPDLCVWRDRHDLDWYAAQAVLAKRDRSLFWDSDLRRTVIDAKPVAEQ